MGDHRVLVLGLGLQGRAAVHDLENSAGVGVIIGADLNIERADEWLERLKCNKTRCVQLDCTDEAAVAQLLRESKADALVCMLPAPLAYKVAKVCIEHQVPYISSSYTGNLVELDGLAKERGVTVLPEMGFDPGIDLIMGREAVAEFDEVHGLYSYGAGFPEADACEAPLNYKLTWTLDGVLTAYSRDYRILVDGNEVRWPGSRLFHSEHSREMDIPGLGRFEVYPNGDALHFATLFGIQDTVLDTCRYVARWPGHMAAWRLLADLNFLSDEPITIKGTSITPRQFLAAHLAPQLQFKKDERDVALIIVDAWGLKDGAKKRVIYQMIDYKDDETGLFAMNRAVGYTVSIAAQMVLDGEISTKGVLSPIDHIPAEAFFAALGERGIHVTRTLGDVATVPELQ